MRWLLTLVASGFLLGQAQPPQNHSAPAAEQAKSPPPCRNDRPLEEYLEELKKSKKQRNKNPLPTGVCVGSLCMGKAGAPQPEKSPAPPPPQPRPKTDSGTGESSSKGSTDEAARNEASDRDALAAAQSVEVGDYYFGEKNYRAALSRYQEALESKPDDAAIYLRLGRAFEKLGEATLAFENHDASLAADAAGPSAEESGKAAERLRPEVEKRGDDPAAIAARNRARIVPHCPKQAPASPIPPH